MTTIAFTPTTNYDQSDVERRQIPLVQQMADFYSNADNFDKFLRLVRRELPITLRQIDFALTHRQPDENMRQYIENHKTQLGIFKKQHFDPFCRRKRFNIRDVNNNVIVSTTLGQLNFCKWLFENNFIEYLTRTLE